MVILFVVILINNIVEWAAYKRVRSRYTVVRVLDMDSGLDMDLVLDKDSELGMDGGLGMDLDIVDMANCKRRDNSNWAAGKHLLVVH